MSQPVQAGGLLDLGHDVVGEAAGKPLAAGGEVLGEDHGGGGQVPSQPCRRIALRKPLSALTYCW